MILNQLLLNIRWIIRDRVLQAIVGMALLLVILVPVLSIFSMRQVQEVAVSLSLSFISLMLFLVATFLGATSIWRDIERRYTTSLLSLPGFRSGYILAKFCAITFALVACAFILGSCAVVAIKLSSAYYPSTIPIRWGHIFLALAADTGKFALLTALAILFSTFSTSFFLPFFATVSLYLAGNASQEVYDYVTREAAVRFSPLSLVMVKAVYYLLPNFGAFNFKVNAVYPVPVADYGILLTVLYLVVYLSLVLSLSVWLFSRRELP